MREWLGRTWQAADLWSSSKHAERARAPPGDHCPPAGAARHDRSHWGSPQLPLCWQQRPPPQQKWGKGGKTQRPCPWQRSREEEFTFCFYISVAETCRKSRGTLQKTPGPSCQVAGQEQPPLRHLLLRQPDLQPGVKVGLTCRGWRHQASLPRAE